MSRILIAVSVVLFIAFGAHLATAGSSKTLGHSQGLVTVEKARFTVITPECIRLEYSDSGKFVDAPSLFAYNREARFTEYTISQTPNQTIIDTGKIRLTYTPDGKAFSDGNLQALIRDQGHADIRWTPSLKNKNNLGGTRQNLDHISGPSPVMDGLLARDGWYVLDDSKRFLLVNNWVAARDVQETDSYLFGYGHDFKGGLSSLTAIGGPVPLPRRYVLGSWYSRWWPYTSNDYRQIVQEYHSHDFPLDMVVGDMDWHKKDNWTGYTWNRQLFPDAENYLKWIHDQDLHVTLNDHPSAGIGTYEDFYPAFMAAMGKDPAQKKVLPYNDGDKQYLTTVFKFAHTPLEKMGVDFWWVDWMGGQEFPFNRIDWVNEVYYQHSRHDGLRGQQFSRWADWGDHRHPIHFSGDTVVTWPTLAFEVPFTAESGNAGAFFWTHDIGGFTGVRNGELLTRWAQFGAFSAALRLHSTNSRTLDKRPWTYSKAEEDAMRIAFHLRSEFFPYTYSRVADSAFSSVPLLRPLYLEYPEVEEAYHNSQEYLYGADVLVAPITTPINFMSKTAAQKVWFPDGLWYDWFTGQSYWGGTTKTFDRDLNSFPLFVRGGIPLTLQPYNERMTDDYLKVLIVRMYPGVEGVTGKSVLYEDDGVTEKYISGERASTNLEYVKESHEMKLQISATQGAFAGQLQQRGYVLEFVGAGPQASVAVDGHKVQSTYEAATQITRVNVLARDIRAPTSVVVSY